MIEVDSVSIARATAVGVLYLFLPLTALTYYLFRRQRRLAEVRRIFAILNIDADYRRAYDDHRAGCYFLVAVAYTSLVSCLGLSLLFLAASAEFPAVSLSELRFPRPGSRLVFAMAFFGAYLWGLQNIFRRYALNDLNPGVYYSLSVRMLLAGATALIIYNVYGALSGGTAAGDGGDLAATLWPALAFLIGMFPQRGVRWLSERLPLLSPATDPAVRRAPLEMIEGVESHDSLRLEELGIDSCYDLAAADFVPLILKTPYSARQLVDWILQAKLCVSFGEAVKDLREHGIRTVVDLETLTDAQLETLAAETALTRSALERARDAVRESMRRSGETKRLRLASEVLSRFWEDEEKPPPDM
jgi:hypothetical protein